MAAVFAEIRKGTFGEPHNFEPLISSITDHGDFYLVSDDFNSYIKTQEMVDEAYKDRDGWLDKSILSVARMGFFSADRAVQEYADGIWNLEAVE